MSKDEFAKADWLREELTAIVREEIGFNDFFAMQMADALLCGLRRRLGGREIYLPSIDMEDRNAEIRAMFNGRNLKEVMRHFGVSRCTIYRAFK